MNKIIPLSLIAVASLYASDIKLNTINVESTVITEVSENANVSADVAQALSNSVPSIDISRRSGIANDILIRGQKRDNISVTVDGTKVCGACPNRMDPPTSHILASQVESIEVIEGPYDVENMGVLSGGLKIKTKEPTKKEEVKLNLGFGSWSYRKIGLTASGGNDLVRFLVTGSMQSSDQYEDGDGNTLAEQTKKNAPTGNQYKTEYEDMQAYKKKSINTKLFINPIDNQELRLSYTANRSDDVMYPNGPMDAIVDDSDIYSVSYDVKNINEIYKNVNLEYYFSRVDHPMSTLYRNSSNAPATDTTNYMKSSIQGIKLKNSFATKNFNILVGLDGSKRTWRGQYLRATTHAFKADSLKNSITTNSAIFAKVTKSFNSLDITAGARYDSTKIENEGNLQDNSYSSFGANLLANYNLNEQNQVFFGLGQASRVPDARELYFLKSGNTVGTPTLDQTTNQEVDLGYETNKDMFKLKIKGFYSKLNNYIYIKKGATTNAFYNIDATVWGAELSASIYATDNITVDMGASYKVGRKDKALSGQTDKDLADIAPLRGNIALNYEYMRNSLATFEIKASDKWDTIDSDNGEQKLDGWTTFNFKVKHAVNKNFDFTIGVDNISDETYATSNTYADLTLVTSGITSETMLLNNPGRYIYTNLDFKF
jgi:iron complex outermembrane receptor protein